MITIPQMVEEHVKNSSYLEEELIRGIINLSALARNIKPEFEQKSLKGIKSGSIIMALKRLSIKLKAKDRERKNYLKKLGDITVRSNLIEITFANSETMIDRHKQLLQSIRKQKEVFLTITQGVYETTVIVSAVIKDTVLGIFKNEKLLNIFQDLSAITIRLPDDAVFYPGVHYEILKQIAWENISIVENVSTYTEFTIILENKFVDRAFSTLNKFLKNCDKIV